MSRALALALAFALLGCLRLGPGDDLHLVCEEKGASPRMAYDIGFLVAQTKVAGELADLERIAMLEVARHHVITPGGVPHEAFGATLSVVEEPAWRFDAVGVREGLPEDVYEVHIRRGEPSHDTVVAPRTIRDAAWKAANASAQLEGELLGATWDAALASCVRLRYADASIVVNVVQGRVVHIER